MIQNLFSFNRYRKLKGFLLPVVGAFFAFPSCTQPQASLSGTLVDVENDTLFVFSSHMSSPREWRTDTVVMKAHHFEVQLPDTGLYVYLTPQSLMPKGSTRYTQGQPILYFPGDQLKVTGTSSKPQATGSELYDGLRLYPEIDRMQDSVSALNQAYTKAYRAKDEAEKLRVKQAVKAQYDELLKAKFAIIQKYPQSAVAAYYAGQLQPEQGLEAISLLSDDVKKGPLRYLIDKAKKSYENRLEQERAKSSLQAGQEAPNFSFTTYAGKEVTLASYEGKYLVLDFWGTWCGWCVKGFPAMKKAYARCKDRVAFLGVSCKDTEKLWREGVAKHQLPWDNVWEGDSKISVRYAINGFPTKILIDPKGKIVQTFVGETPVFYQKLEELLEQ